MWREIPALAIVCNWLFVAYAAAALGSLVAWLLLARRIGPMRAYLVAIAISSLVCVAILAATKPAHRLYLGGKTWAALTASGVIDHSGAATYLVAALMGLLLGAAVAALVNAPAFAWERQEDSPRLRVWSWVALALGVWLTLPAWMGLAWLGVQAWLLRDVVGLTRRGVELEVYPKLVGPWFSCGGFGHVELEGPAIDDEVMEQLAKLGGADSLDMTDTKVTQEGMAWLKEFTRLQGLELAGRSRFDGEVLKHTRGFWGLRYVRLEGPQFRDEHVGHLSNLTTLTDLYLAHTRCDGSSLGSLANNSALQSVTLRDCPLSEAAFEGLSKLRGLTSLNINRCTLNDEWLRHLGASSSLKSIGLIESGVSGKSFRHLAAVRSLTSLQVPDLKIGEWDLRPLWGHPALATLILPGCRLEGSAAAEFEGISRLRYLDLANSNIRDADLEVLARHPSLVDLDVRNTDLPPGAVARFEVARRDFFAKRPATMPPETLRTYFSPRRSEN